MNFFSFKGNVTTHKTPRDYKQAVAYTLAQVFSFILKACAFKGDYVFPYTLCRTMASHESWAVIILTIQTKVHQIMGATGELERSKVIIPTWPKNVNGRLALPTSWLMPMEVAEVDGFVNTAGTSWEKWFSFLLFFPREGVNDSHFFSSV